MDSEPIIIPIEIRPGYFVRIMGITHDLSKEEASKIVRVVEAMASPLPYNKDSQ